MRRLFWIGVGVGSTLWTQRRLKERVGEITPANVGREAVRTARWAGEEAVRTAVRAGDEAIHRVGESIAEGRQVARVEEDRLRAELAVKPVRSAWGPPGR